MGDLTQNFSYSEFKPHGSDKNWKPSSEYQKLLIVNLAKDLQIVRDSIPANCFMDITSGVRTIQDYYRLKNQGLNPSKTSDHYFGMPIKLDKNSEKYNKFGETYNFTVGAVDVVPIGFSSWDLFKIAFNLINSGVCDFGQLIYEKNPKNGIDWVHFGGSMHRIFTENLIALIGRDKIMKSMDGGKSYSVVTYI